jgi:hypothetical protein
MANPRAEAARLRSPVNGTSHAVQADTPPPAAPNPLAEAAGPRRGR